MFVSEFIIDLLQKHNIDTVFGITGTAVNMLFVAAERKEGMRYICPLHEQAASMAADGYSRVTGKIGVCIATSGPGVTNLITGVAGAYTESVPMLVIVGQAQNALMSKKTDLRYYGFQEFNTVKAFEAFTKYAKEVKNAGEVGFEIEKAISIAMSGRKGPVVLSFPEDILYAEAVTEYRHYEPVENGEDKKEKISECYRMLAQADRPVLLFGGGIHCANAETEALEAVESIKCPVLLTYPARDLLNDRHGCNAGSIGIFGSRAGNFALCNADLIIGVGCRFDGYATGDPRCFAENAKVIAVDIDENELEKYEEFGIRNDLRIKMDAKAFLKEFAALVSDNNYNAGKNSDWCGKVKKMRDTYPLCKEEYGKEESVNPYCLVAGLSKVLKNGTQIFVDTGLSSAWLGQAFQFKDDQRMMSQFGFSAMGYSLPAAIGACFADPQKKVVCFTGDGSLQMNIQELATAAHYKLNLAIIVICNGGYGLIQKTQDDFNNGHAATDREHGVGIPDIAEISRAYGIKTYKIDKNSEIETVFTELTESKSVGLCCVNIDIKKRITPRKRGKGSLEDLYPPVEEEI